MAIMVTGRLAAHFSGETRRGVRNGGPELGLDLRLWSRLVPSEARGLPEILLPFPRQWRRFHSPALPWVFPVPRRRGPPRHPGPGPPVTECLAADSPRRFQSKPPVAGALARDDSPPRPSGQAASSDRSRTQDSRREPLCRCPGSPPGRRDCHPGQTASGQELVSRPVDRAKGRARWLGATEEPRSGHTP